MENENNTKTDCKKKIIWETYRLLAEARASGDASYHALANVYAFLHSIMVAALSILVTQGIHCFLLMALVLAIVVAGMILCLQTGLAQSLYTQKNAFFDWKLRKIEQKNKWPEQIFTELCQLQKEQKEFKDFTTNWVSRHHERWWASRLKTFPWIFGSIYLCFGFYAVESHYKFFWK